MENKLAENRLALVESILAKIEETLDKISAKAGVNVSNIAKDISNAVIESLKSGAEVGQEYVSKMKKRKLKPRYQYFRPRKQTRKS